MREREYELIIALINRGAAQAASETANKEATQDGYLAVRQGLDRLVEARIRAEELGDLHLGLDLIMTTMFSSTSRP